MKTAMKPTTCWRQLPALLAAGLLVLAGGSAWAQLPTVSSRAETWTGSGPPPERDAIERAQWEPWLLQREQERRQLELTRQQDARIRQSQESLGQRALREQAQRNGSSVPGRPGLSDQEQAWREQQQLQREQWRQQRELTREDDQRQRQSQESLGQRALREQALGRAASPSGGQVSPPAQRPGRRDY
jgi:hypothetical protein